MSNENDRREEIASVMDAIKGIAIAVCDIWDVFQRHRNESPTGRGTEKDEDKSKDNPEDQKMNKYK